MKKLLFIFCMAVAAQVFMACSKEDNPVDVDVLDNPQEDSERSLGFFSAHDSRYGVIRLFHFFRRNRAWNQKKVVSLQRDSIKRKRIWMQQRQSRCR